MSNSLWPHGLQHARLLCPPLSPRVCSDSCPLSWRCYLTISFSAAPLLLLPSIFPSIRVFSSESALYTRWPALASVLSMNIQGWFSLGLTGLISLRPRTLKSLLQHHNSKASFLKKKKKKHHLFNAQLSLWSSSHICTWLLKNHRFDYMHLCQQSDVSAF